MSSRNNNRAFTMRPNSISRSNDYINKKKATALYANTASLNPTPNKSSNFSNMNFNKTELLLREVKNSKDNYSILNALTSLRQEIEELNALIIKITNHEIIAIDENNNLISLFSNFFSR